MTREKNLNVISKAHVFAWKAMTTRQLNRRIVFMSVMMSLFYAGIAYCADSSTLDTAERIDKLGATGILAFGFILSIGANIYLIRLVFGQLKEVVEKNTIASTQMMDAMEECNKRK